MLLIPWWQSVDRSAHTADWQVTRLTSQFNARVHSTFCHTITYKSSFYSIIFSNFVYLSSKFKFIYCSIAIYKLFWRQEYESLLLLEISSKGIVPMNLRVAGLLIRPENYQTEQQSVMLSTTSTKCCEPRPITARLMVICIRSIRAC